MAWPTHLAAADRAVLQILGGRVTYAPRDGEAVEVQGIFDAAFVRVDAGKAGVSSVGPALFVRLSDLPSDPQDDDPTITVNGVAYELREAEPDGQGAVRLLLHVRT